MRKDHKAKLKADFELLSNVLGECDCIDCQTITRMPGQDAFIDKCVTGESRLDEIDDFIDVWHKGGTGVSLTSFLGMTRTEYAAWVNDSRVLDLIVAARKQGRPFADVVRDDKSGV